MKSYKLFLLLMLLLLSTRLVKANENQPCGIDLGEYAFGIPVEQLNFNNQTPFTFSFWVNIKEFNHGTYGTQFINIRNPNGDWISCDFGYLWSIIMTEEYGNLLREDILSMSTWEMECSTGTLFQNLKECQFYPKKWVYVSFVFYYANFPQMMLYINGEPTLKYVPTYEGSTLRPWYDEYIIMIGGPAFERAPLNAYIDKVQLYNKALSQTEIEESMYAPLLNDDSLLGYWDFEGGSTTDAEGFMLADNGTIKATMYKIQQAEGGISSGTEIQPFTYGEGVNPESVLQGIEENVTSSNKTKAYIANGVLNIENEGGITSVEVYNSLGTPLFRREAGGEDTSIQIPLPATLKGVIIVKVNNEVVKVIKSSL